MSFFRCYCLWKEQYPSVIWHVIQSDHRGRQDGRSPRRARADQGHARQPPATARQAERLAAKPRGSQRPHGFVIGDHPLPASWAAGGCKFVHVLAALLTVVAAPCSIPLDVERP